MKKTVRFISMLLALIMAFTAFSSTALAAEADAYPEVVFSLKKSKIVIVHDEIASQNPTKVRYKVKSGKVKTEKYKSSNKRIVEVDDNGFLYVHGLGEVVITVKKKKKYSKKCKVVVKEAYAIVLKGESVKYPKINRKDYKGWKCKDKSVVRCEKNRVRGLKDGKSTVLYKKVKGRKYTVHIYSVAKNKLVRQFRNDAPEFFKYDGKLSYEIAQESPYFLSMTYNIYPRYLTVKEDGYKYKASFRAASWYYSKKGFKFNGAGGK